MNETEKFSQTLSTTCLNRALLLASAAEEKPHKLCHYNSNTLVQQQKIIRRACDPCKEALSAAKTVAKTQQDSPAPLKMVDEQSQEGLVQSIDSYHWIEKLASEINDLK
ncbi:hypothetical protein OH492_15145 [Vibrio chagasii]|nr:hypothetical protein [Vibrio chagasii]